MLQTDALECISRIQVIKLELPVLWERLQSSYHEAYNLLCDKGIPTDRGDCGELTDYELPVQETWTRQLRNARKALGEQKYTPRAGRSRGGSVATSGEI